MGSRMRVCFVVPMAGALFGYGNIQYFGGAELQMWMIGRELAADSRFDVHFVVESDTVESQQVAGMTVWTYVSIKRGIRGLSFVRNQVSLLAALFKARAKVCVQSPAGFITATVLVWCRASAGKLIYWLASNGDVDGSIVASTAQRRVFLWALQRASRLVAQGRWQQEQLMELYGKPSTILPNAFPVPDAPPVAPKDTVLWVASSQNLKQPWLFLELARAFPHESFTMVMPKNDVALWERIAQEVPDLPNLTFIEHVPLPEIQPYFDRAKLFVNTSTVEGFPNTFVQSAMGATPVLSLNVDPDEVLTANGFGICAHGDFERLSADLGELLGDDALRTEMGARAFEYAKRTHDIKSVIRLFEQVLEEVARG